MNSENHKTAVLWTGGKDCCLALHNVVQRGGRVDFLVTFAPANPQFLAHPLAVMKAQAQSLGIEHLVMQVSEPFGEGYRDAIRSLRDGRCVGTLVTGDIDLVGGLPNWIVECCEGLEVAVEMPLWNRPREGLMAELLDGGYEVVMSLVKPPLTESWVGRRLDRQCVAELRQLHRDTGLDICGENGEYHSLVLDGPAFSHRIHLDWQPASRDGMWFMQISGSSDNGSQ